MPQAKAKRKRKNQENLNKISKINLNYIYSQNLLIIFKQSTFRAALANILIKSQRLRQFYELRCIVVNKYFFRIPKTNKIIYQITNQHQQQALIN